MCLGDIPGPDAVRVSKSAPAARGGSSPLPGIKKVKEDPALRAARERAEHSKGLQVKRRTVEQRKQEEAERAERVRTVARQWGWGVV